MTRLIAAGLARGGAIGPGWLELEGDRVRSLGTGPAPRPPDEAVAGVLCAGLVDLQVNGGAGAEVARGSGALDAIDALQLRHGVTGYLATIPTVEPEAALAVVRDVEERVEDPASPVLGVHLEGPFLDPGHAGMHRRELLAMPASSALATGASSALASRASSALASRASSALVEAYRSSALRMVTLAPELPGALELTAALHRRGVLVALGHSGASFEQAVRAVTAGARAVTHLFNCMPALHHRRPGLAAAALLDERVFPTLIADGHHVDPVMLRLCAGLAGERVVLVSDASPAAGAAPGDYRLAGVEITARQDGSVVTGEGRLAGSTLTLDAAVRGWARLAEMSLGQALAAASDRPRALLGLAPGLRPGARADLVALDESGHVQGVMLRGRWLWPPALAAQ